MVLAILAQIKKMTRRTAGLEVINEDPNSWQLFEGFSVDEKGRLEASFHSDDGQTLANAYCPYGKPGDVLWVRETWNQYYSGEDSLFAYKASDAEFPFKGWKPSIFMPRLACRIFLEIVDIRVERLRDIDQKDAQAEGVIINFLSE